MQKLIALYDDYFPNQFSKISIGSRVTSRIKKNFKMQAKAIFWIPKK